MPVALGFCLQGLKRYEDSICLGSYSEKTAMDLCKSYMVTSARSKKLLFF